MKGDHSDLPHLHFKEIKTMIKNILAVLVLIVSVGAFGATLKASFDKDDIRHVERFSPVQEDGKRYTKLKGCNPCKVGPYTVWSN